MPRMRLLRMGRRATGPRAAASEIISDPPRYALEYCCGVGSCPSGRASETSNREGSGAVDNVDGASSDAAPAASLSLVVACQCGSSAGASKVAG